MPVNLHGKYFGTEEAAAILERTPGRIQQMVRWGEMEAIAVSPKVWLIPEKEIKRVLRERKSPAA
jgi:hypothetical protein